MISKILFGDMIMKKLISICLVLILTIGTLSSCNLSNTADEPTEGLEFHLLEDGTYGVSVGEAKEFEKIIIPATYNDKAVTKIMDKAFFELENVISITVPDSVTSIGEYAFSESKNLKNLTIGNGVTFVGAAAFNNCYSLEYNKYENGSYLGNDTNPYVVLVFASVVLAGETTEFKIHDDTKIIHFSAFHDYGELKSITIPSNVTCIGDSAFYKCKSLTSVTIPDSVTNIGDMAFSYCDTLKSVKIGSGVTSIGSDLFYDCNELNTVELFNGITSIEPCAFGRCPNLKSIIFHGTEAEWSVIDDCVRTQYTNNYTVTYTEQ